MDARRALYVAAVSLALAGCVTGSLYTGTYRSYGPSHYHPYGWHRGYYPRSWYHDRGYGWYDHHPRYWRRGHRHYYGGWYRSW